MSNYGGTPAREARMSHYLATRPEYTSDVAWAKANASSIFTIHRWGDRFPAFEEARRALLKKIHDDNIERLKALVGKGARAAEVVIEPEAVGEAMALLQGQVQKGSNGEKVEEARLKQAAAVAVVDGAAKMYGRILRGAERLAPDAFGSGSYEDRRRWSLTVQVDEPAGVQREVPQVIEKIAGQVKELVEHEED